MPRKRRREPHSVRLYKDQQKRIDAIVQAYEDGNQDIRDAVTEAFGYGKDVTEDKIHYQIIVTYGCNASCQYCCQNIDVMKWDHFDSNVTVEEIRKAGQIVQEHGISVGKIKITGGEPLTHPDLKNVAEEAMRSFKPTRWGRVCTNGLLPKIPLETLSYSTSPLFQRSPDKKDFNSWRVSPADIGMEPRYGYATKPCHMQQICGRGFDKFGFTFCPLAGTIGQVLDKEVYDSKPQTMGQSSICEHCIMSVGRKQRWEIHEAVKQGKMKPVSKTWVEGIKRWRDEKKRLIPKTFLERLATQKDEPIKSRVTLAPRTKKAGETPELVSIS